MPTTKVVHLHARFCVVCKLDLECCMPPKINYAPVCQLNKELRFFSGEKEDHDVTCRCRFNFTVTQPKCRQTEPENISEFFRQLTYIGLCVLTIPSITERILRISKCMCY